MINKSLIEALYLKDLKRAQETFDAMIRDAEYTKQYRLAALDQLKPKEGE